MRKRRNLYRFLRGVLALGIVLIGIGGVIGAQGASSVPAFCNNPFKLMPLGDSLTMGKYTGLDTSIGAEEDDIGYRMDLKNLMVSSGYDVDFVGTLKNGDDPPNQPFPDEDHEGHPGFTDLLIANGISGWLSTLSASSNNPDVILLHIGTNSPRDPANVGLILDNIYTFDEDIIIFVARIIRRLDGTNITAYNNNVENIVENRPEFGTNLFMVDMEDGAGIEYVYPGGDFRFDNIHLIASGYVKMAKVWKREIDKICGFPQLVTPGAQSTEEGEAVSLDIPIDRSYGYTISFDATGLPDGLTLTKINDSLGRISGTIPGGARSGSPYNTTVTISDDSGELDQISFSWTVYRILDYYLPLATSSK